MIRSLLLFVLLFVQSQLFAQYIRPNFSQDVAVGCGPLTVSFQDKTTGPHKIVAWHWDFGDGDTANVQNPVHTYTQRGKYTVHLWVTDSVGTRDSTIYWRPLKQVVVQPGLDIGDQYLVCTMYDPNNKVTIRDKMANPYDPAVGSYQWSTGDTTSSISVNTPGLYTVTYEACGETMWDSAYVWSASSSTQAVDSGYWINEAYHTRFSVDIPFNRSVIKEIYVYWGDNQWETFDDEGTVMYKSDFNHQYHAPGTYLVTFTTSLKEQNGSCDTALYNYNLVVKEPELVKPAWSGRDTVINQGDTLTLDAGVADYYYWLDIPRNILFAYTRTIPVTETGIYAVEMGKGGDRRYDTIRVQVRDTSVVTKPEAHMGIQQQDCAAVWFTDSSTVTGASIVHRQWDFGNGRSDTTRNPRIVYQENGDYNVRLIVSNNLGESDTAFSTVSIHNVLPEAVLGPDTTVQHGPVVLGAGNSQGAAFRYLWSTGDTTRTITVTQPGMYRATVTNELCGLTDADTIEVIFPHQMTPKITIDSIRCNTVYFRDSTISSHPVVKWEWQFGDGATDTLQHPVHTYGTNGIFQVRLKVTNINGFADSTGITVTADNIPVVDLGADTVIMPGDSIRLYATTEPPGQWTRFTWSTGHTTHAIAVTQPGTYWVTATYCGAAMSDTIVISPGDTVVPNPADIGAVTTVNANDSLSVNAQFHHSFGSNNVFTVQLLEESSADGKMAGEADGLVMNIAAIADTSRRLSLQVSIPDTVPCSQDYRVRIVSSAPADTTDWSSRFEVVNMPVATVLQRGDSLFAGRALAYQWYLDDAAIAGATRPYYRARANGRYYVTVSNGGSCRSTSATVHMIITAVEEVNAGENTVKVFPVPTAGILHLLFEKPLLKPVRLALYNTQGNAVYIRQVQEQAVQADLGHLPKGVYFLELAGDNRQETMRIILQ